MINYQVSMTEIVSLCKRRGFIFQNSELYGGLQGIYDYGPLGVELKNNIKTSWWKSIVYERGDIEGLDSSIITHKLTLKYSGHEDTFCDLMVDCKDCKTRMRLDSVNSNLYKCENCLSENLTESRNFNLMFRSNFGPIDDNYNYVYLRPETAQGIFLNFKNVVDTTHKKLPFGIAQIGKSFRNEITPKNFIFRTREFEQMELEFFVEPGKDEEWHKYWVENRFNWWKDQGLSQDNLKLENQEKDKLSHYSKSTIDILYRFPQGFEELEGIANRTDFDLNSHSNSKLQSGLESNSKVLPNLDSNTVLSIKSFPDKEISNKSIIPFVIEPSAGLDRGVLAILSEAYTKELVNKKERIVLKLKPHLSPFKASIIPLVNNNEKIVSKSKEIFNGLTKIGIGRIRYEDTGNIGKAYRRNDEIGTPYCITIDFKTFEDSAETVTVRFRDSMLQERIPIRELEHFIRNSIFGN